MAIWALATHSISCRVRSAQYSTKILEKMIGRLKVDMNLVRFFGATAHSMIGATFLLATLAGGSAQSQTIQRIAAIVNDEVISAYDLDQRINLVVRTSNATVSDEEVRRLRAQILQSLVDEKLQAQATKEFDIQPNEEEVKQSYSRIAQQNKLKADDLVDYFKEIDVDISTLDQQIKTDVAWRELIMRRYGSQVKIGEEEVQEVLERLVRNQGRPENQVSEIFLSVDSPDQEPTIRNGATRLVEQLRLGAPFAAVARQFSQSSSAAVGGSVGWVQSGEFSEEVESVIDRMSPGDISDPIPSRGGFYIIKLDSRREVFGSDPMQTLYKINQFAVPYDGEDAPENIDSLAARMVKRAGETEGCDDAAFSALTEEFETTVSASIPQILAGDLPDLFRKAVSDLKIGQHSTVIRGPKSFHILYVCDRQDQQQAMPTEDQIADRLFEEEVSMLARRYLRDLRRDATIEYR